MGPSLLVTLSNCNQITPWLDHSKLPFDEVSRSDNWYFDADSEGPDLEGKQADTKLISLY